MILNMLCEYFDKGICSDSLIKSYMVIIFTELLRVYKSDVGAHGEAEFIKAGESDVGAIISYIREHCETVTLETAARQFNFHPSTLCTILKNMVVRSLLTLFTLLAWSGLACCCAVRI